MTSDLNSILWELAAIILYFILLLIVAGFSYRKHLTSSDFIIGGRSLNSWLTALAVHASDMSSWLFMGYPAAIFTFGVHQAWIGIGLLICMLLSWKIVAPRVRIATEQFNSLTLSSFFESRLVDTSGLIRVFTAIMLFIFYTIYISSALVGMGFLLNTLFGINYSIGVLVGTIIVIPYVFFGGYLTLAWIDLFQGMFLMLVILFVPFHILPSIGGWEGIFSAIREKNLTSSLLPDFSSKTLLNSLFLALGWGLGYFGQPHIVTKFMGIRNVSEIKKSKYIGMTWMVLSLGAATLVGLVGIAFFKNTTLMIDTQVFIQMVKQTFPPFVIGFILCAVLAATINAMSSMVLVLTSSLTEDFYKRLFRKNASSKELLIVSRLGVVLVSLIAFSIAFGNISTIYELVLYAWSGLGASFGPLLLLCLYSEKVNKYGAWAGILSGGLIAAIWPYINQLLFMDIPPLLPSFLISFILIWIISMLTQSKKVLKKN